MLNFGLKQMLMDEVVDPAAGTGAGAVTMESVTALIKKEVNDGINGFSKRFVDKDLPTHFTALSKGITEQLTALTASLVKAPPETQEVEPNAEKVKDPETKALLLRQEKRMRELQEKLDASDNKTKVAEEKSRNTGLDSAVREALSGFTFVSETAAKDAFQLVRSAVAYEEGGDQIMAGEFLLKDFVNDIIPTQKSYLLAPQQKGGAGAGPGNGNNRATGIQVESIKPGMKPEDQASAAKAILSAIGTI